MLGLLLLTEGVHPNPGPISDGRLNKAFERILGGSDRAESPSFISFQKCLAQVSRDAEMTRRSPGDGMNTPPPEPKPQDGTTQNETGSTCHSTTDDVGIDTRADQIRSPQITRSDVTSVDTPVVPHEDRVYPDSDADDVDDSVIPSVSANSLNINDFIAESRLQSRTASNLNDDFYTNSERSSVAEERAETSVDTPVIPHEDIVYRDSDADDVDESVIPSVSANSLNINDFIAESRLQSRTASNLNDDFYTNSERSSVAEERDETSVDTPVVPHEDRVYPDSDADDVDDCVIPSVSANSLNIKDFIAESRLQSRTASNLNDDFYTNSERSSVAEERAETSVDTPVVPPEDRAYPDSDADDVDDCVIPSVSANSLNINDFIAESRLQSRTASNLNDDFYTNSERSSVAEERAETSVDTPVVPHEDRVYPDSASANSLNINDFIVESRIQSRTASNMNDDFYTNSERSSVMEERGVTCPGDGMNTPPPEAKPPDGTNQNETGSTCHSTTDDVGVDTRADHIRSPHITRSDITSVDTSVVPHEDRVYPDSDADDVDDCVIPSVSANSLNIKDFIAESRLQSRTASNLNDDFYTNSERSSVAEERAETSVDTPVVPHEDRVYPDSVSANSLNINDFIVESRIQSRTASNMNDDFYTNSERSCVMEERDVTCPGDGMNTPPPEAKPPDGTNQNETGSTCHSTTDDVGVDTRADHIRSPHITRSDITSVNTSVVPPEDRVYPDSDADDVDDCVIPSVSANSLNIKDFIAESRLQSRTASNLNDDFYTNSERSSVAEERAETSVDTPVVPHEDRVYPDSVSANSLNINDFIVESRIQSRTASNMNDDFYTNSERSCVMEERDVTCPGDGMNTPPPEAKPPDGTNQNETGSTCHSTTDDVGVDTRADHIRSPHITRSDITSVDTSVVPHEDRVYPDSDADDVDDGVIPSASANSLNINDFIAGSRLQSRTASNLNDDFYTNSERSSVAEERAETSVDTPVVPNEDRVYPDSDADDVDDCVIPSVSANSLNINDFIAESRLQSRTASNLNDDFYTNSERSSVAEERTETSVVTPVVPHEDRVYPDSDADDVDDCVIHSVSANSLNIKDFIAESRLQSRTASNLNDDFYTNSERSSVAEERAETSSNAEQIKWTPGEFENKRANSTKGEVATTYCVLPSASGDCMDINVIYAQAHAASKTANTTDDDFCCNYSTSSDEENQDDARWQVAGQTTEIVSVGTGGNGGTDNLHMPEEAEGKESEAEDDRNVLPFASSHSMDVNVIYTQARAASRTAANMDDDFCCNDSTSSDEEDSDCARMDEICTTAENVSAKIMDESESQKRTPTPCLTSKADDTDCEAEDDESVRPSASGDSMDLNTIYAQARAVSRTAADMDNGFYCNGEEDNDYASEAMKKKSVTFASSETITREEKISKIGIHRAATPFPYSSTVNRQFGKVCDDSPMDNSHIDESSTLRKSARLSVADRVIEGAENNERSVKNTPTDVTCDKFKNLLQRVIDRSSVIPSASEAAADALKNCRTDSPFLFAHNDDVFMASDDEGETDLENESLSTTRDISDALSDITEEPLSTTERKRDTSDIEDELAFTPSVQDDDDNTLEAFYNTSPTDRALTGKLREINDRAISRMRTPCALLSLFSDQGNATDTIEYSAGVPVRTDSETDFYKSILKGTRVSYADNPSTPGPEVPGDGIPSTRLGGVPHAGKPSATYTPFIATEVQELSSKTSPEGSPIRSSVSKECLSENPVYGSSANLGVKHMDPSQSDNQSDKSQPTKKKNEKKRKGKGSKRAKEELGAVNRLSPTSMFTAPLLGPIKSDRNSPLMADIQMNRCVTEHLEKTTSVQDDDDNTLEAFYHTSPTDRALTEKLREINDRASSRMRAHCALLDLLSEQGHEPSTFESSSDVFVLDIEDTVKIEDADTLQSPRSQPTKKKNKKKRKGKWSKIAEEEFGAVNRLSPTSMFTAPVLGPIKRDRNSPLMDDIQINRSLTEQIEQTASVQDDDDNTLQAFCHASHTDIALTAKINAINDRAKSRMRTSCSLLDLLSDQGQPTQKKKEKKRKGKGSKRAKEELGAVNRLSPTSMFTAPLLGPIKSDRNNTLMTDRQMSRSLTEQLEETTSVQDDDDNTLQAFYHTSHTDIALTEKIKAINDRANSRMRTSCSLLDLLSDQGQPTKKKNEKRRKGKASKGAKEELGAVNRLSPTSMFTAPVLGPIKSDRNYPLMADRQMNRCLTEQLEKTTPVTDGYMLQNDSQPAKKNKKTKEPKRKKEELKSTSMFTAPFLGPIKSDQNSTLTTDRQTNSQPNRKSKKEKEQKHVKEELETVNRLSPTSMFTAPVLGPKKSSKNNLSIVNTQTNRPSGNIDNGVIASPVPVGETSEVKTEGNILQKAVTKLRKNDDEPGQHLPGEDTTPVFGCLQTRSLTVAKFRAQFNRTCILLPETDTTHKREKQRQEKLKKFQAKMVQINKRAALLVDRHRESEEKAANGNIDNGVIFTPTSANKMDRTDGNILQKAFTELGDNGDHIGQNLAKKDVIPVSGCLQTRSLTVAKFRTQLNRTCVLLPEIDSTHKKDKQSQNTLKEFQAKMVQINKTATLLVDMQQESEEKAVTDTIDNGVIVTPTSANEMDRTDGNILQKAFTELGDNGDHIGQHLVEKDATPVSGCLQTRSLTVAKFRTQLNRTCVLLPEKGEKQSESHLGYADIQSRDEHRQKKLTEFQDKIDKINRKAILLLDMQNEPKENAVKNQEAFTKSDIQFHGPDELTGFKEVTNEQNQLSSGKDITENQTTFPPHAPTGSKPSFVRRRRKFRQMSVDEQQKLKLRIANNEMFVPKAPNEQISNNISNQVSKPTRRNVK